MEAYQSWGRYPKSKPGRVVPLFWRDSLPALASLPGPLLPYGMGRSYGDSCLNGGGTVLACRGLDRFMGFDPATGLLRCEAGVSFDEILKVMVPRGWFLPTTPGTRFVTVGGAIANDVHGKNHHVDGTFGAHVTRLELLRSDGRRLACSRAENAELFAATIGGLGLTGLITWAEFRMAPIAGSLIQSESVKTRDLDEFFDISAQSEADWPFIVSWVDVTARGRRLGRGLFNRGRWAAPAMGQRLEASPEPKLVFPLDLPSVTLNPLSIRLFCAGYYMKQTSRVAKAVTHYEPFFYPLDAILDWNRGYGKRGFVQWQCLLPWDAARKACHELLEAVAASGQGSPVSVMKTCGGMQPAGQMSFMRARGVTLAMDFPMCGKPLLDLLERLDAVVRASGGAVYIGKDARMSAESFRAFYPNWQDFARHIDPAFSSDFWRRVNP